MVYYRESAAIATEMGYLPGLTLPLKNIGNIFFDQGELDSAEFYFEKAIEISFSIEDKDGIANAWGNLAKIYREKGQFGKAEDYGIKAYDLSHEVGDVRLIRSTSSLLSELYEQKRDFRKALEYHKEYILFRDSISNEENVKATLNSQFQQEYDRKFLADSVKSLQEKRLMDAELYAQEVENEKQRQFQYVLYIGLFLAIILILFIFNRFRITRKQKDIIEEQKKEVEEQKSQIKDAYSQLETKNDETLDSISYAKRIQTAILPPMSNIETALPQSFVLYKPKDIVAGDFYWMESVGEQLFFAVADCTGHGVPGAMVSVICNNALNRSVREYGLRQPAAILDKAREIVIEEFSKSSEDVKDGMDIALVSISKNPEDSTYQVEYAGAHNPLWIIRNGNDTLEEIKGNKQPIGNFALMKSFTNHRLMLNSEDSVYIFSDGYADQFGGEKGKKFKTKNLKELLLSIRTKNMDAQSKALDENFETWKGDFEQLDDVCIAGIKFS